MDTRPCDTQMDFPMLVCHVLVCQIYNNKNGGFIFFIYNKDDICRQPTCLVHNGVFS